MLLATTQADLVAAFRSRDQRGLELPEGLRFPFVLRDYLAWVAPSGERTSIVFELAPRRLLGIVFRRDAEGGVGSQLCSFCHCFSAHVSLLTAEKSSKRRVGVLACRDIRCAERLEEAADLAGRNARDLKARQLDRLRAFAREALGIERVP